MKHPVQPIVEVQGVTRFKENPIVTALLDVASDNGLDMNDIAVRFHDPKYADDRQHFAQLIGYSVGGYAELSYADSTVDRAVDAMLEGGAICEKEARIKVLEEELAEIKAALKRAAVAAFNVHPDDLESA
jgi:hypothetical protein